MFRSKFRHGSGADFFLRQYHLCREELSSAYVHLVLLLAFAVLLCLFGRAVWNLFATHGADLNPWYRSLVMGAVGVMVASVLRRIWKKFADIQALRHEITHFRRELRGGHVMGRTDGREEAHQQSPAP